jgi:phosphoribosylamine-glycine ligase
MARLGDDCLFISAREKQNIDEMRDVLYKRVRELHVQKYPYNDFLYPEMMTTDAQCINHKTLWRRKDENQR